MSGTGGNDAISMPNGLVGIVLSRYSYNVKWSERDLASLVDVANKLKKI